MVKNKKAVLRPHQKEAVAATLAELKKADRCYIVMACGTGKTLTSLKIAEQLNPQSIVVFVPSLALINQIMKEWLSNTEFHAIDSLVVCSDSAATRGAEDTSVLFEPIDFKVTTSPQDVKKFLIKSTHKVKLIFCTYQSSIVLCSGVSLAKTTIDFAIYDEAHKTAGFNKEQFGYALHNENIKIKKRLFMTATPRHGTERRDKNGDLIPLYSMDDNEIYGRLAYKLGFRDAINLGLICDFEIIISAIEESSSLNHKFNDEYELQEKAISLQKALKKYNANKAITFHSSIAHAESFAECLRLNNVHENILHINANMGMDGRIKTMQTFKAAKKSIITNARCLTEGVDVPSVDMVAFLNPRSSKIDIVQAIGRALRNNPGKKRGYIFLPVLTKNLANVDKEILSSEYKMVWEVLLALNEQDSDLADFVKNVASKSGEAGRYDGLAGPKLNSGHSKFIQFSSKELQDIIYVKMLDKMVSTWDKWLPHIQKFHNKFGIANFKEHTAAYPELCSYIKRLRATRSTLPQDRFQILDRMGLWNDLPTTWEMCFISLQKYKADHGDTIVTMANPRLKNWLSKQRQYHRSGLLERDKYLKLKELGVTFYETKEMESDESFVLRYEQLKKYFEEKGTTHVPQRGKTQALGKWVCAQREYFKAGKMPEHRKLELDKLGFVWDFQKDLWDTRYNEYKEYIQKQLPKMSKELGSWVTYQRKAHKRGLLSERKINLLEDLNFDFSKQGTGNTPVLESKGFKEYKEYLRKHGGVAGLKKANPQVYKWLYRVRCRYKKDSKTEGRKLTPDEIKGLEAGGVVFLD